MRVAFFGLPLAALLLDADGHDIALACISRPDATGMRRLTKRLGDRVVPKPDVAGSALLRRVEEVRPELIVSWFWTTRLPGRLLAVAPRGGLGVHPSLLPRHRGPDPYFWAIDAGDDETGVTAHVLDDDYDTGAILGQRKLRIDPTWDAWTLARRLDRPSLGLLRDVVRAFARGEPPDRVPQDDARATQAPAPSDAELAVRWAETSTHIVRRVRAAGPWPGASAQIGECPLALIRVQATDDFPRALVAGEAAVRTDGVAVVRTSDGAVELHEGRDEEDRTLDARALSLLVSTAREAT